MKRYDYLKFAELEKMSDTDLEKEIAEAYKDYLELQEYFREMELEASDDMYSVFPDLELHISRLNIIESYIRKAENVKSNLEGLSRYSRLAKLRTKNIIKIKR